MKIIVNTHSIQIISSPVNEQEINVTKCYFEFAEEITDEFVKEAYFTLDDNTYKKIIVNNECEIPNEVLTKVGTIELGVVAYLVENEEEIVRYNPKPGYFTSWKGSLKDAENSEPITPSEMEQYEQALNDGLDALDDALDDLQDKVDSGYFDGQDGRDGVDGTDGITPTIGDNGNWYLGDEDTGKPSRGEQGLPGETGATGQPGRDGAIQYTAGNNITIENNVISASSGGLKANEMPIYILKVGSAFQYDTTLDYVYSNFDATEKSAMADIVNEAVINKGYSQFGLMILPTNGARSSLPIMLPQMSNLWAKPKNITFLFFTPQNYAFSHDSQIKYNAGWLIVRGNWTDDTYAVSSMELWGSASQYLDLRNTASFTPTSNYHPATKKYVDDAITNSITDALGGSY